jgi:hypothetical protein
MAVAVRVQPCVRGEEERARFSAREKEATERERERERTGAFRE